MLVALVILDSSIDIDHLTANSLHTNNLESYDDIDSYSELILEKICNDDNLTPEGNNDDKRPSEKNTHKLPTIIFFSYRNNNELIPRNRQVILSGIWPVSTDTKFHFEDFSCSDFHPPDFYLQDVYIL